MTMLIFGRIGPNILTLSILMILLIFGTRIFGQNRLIAIADGRNLPESPKATQSETNFIKNEVKSNEQRIKAIAQKAEFKCDEDDAKENLANENVTANLGVEGGWKGAFTKPKSSQKIYSYQICWSDGGKYARAFGGIVIVENQKTVSHFVFAEANGIDFIRVLPDINRNGLSEVVLGNSAASGLRIWRSLEIVEIGADKVMSLGEAQTYEMPDEENVAFKTSVKAGKTPVFYREIYTSNPESDKASWKIKKKSKRFALGGINTESSFDFVKLSAAP